MDIHYEQLDEFRNLVMLESVFGRILRSSVNGGRAEKKQRINANATHFFATDRCNYENDI